MEWMPRKQRRYRRTPPRRFGHAVQNQEQEHRGGDVQQNAGQVMSPGSGCVDLAVQHVRQPGQRMPVARVKTKRPDQASPSQAGLHQRIIRHILLIIILNKTVTQRRQVKHQRDEPQACGKQASELCILRLHFHAATMMRNHIGSSMANVVSNGKHRCFCRAVLVVRGPCFNMEFDAGFIRKNPRKSLQFF